MREVGSEKWRWNFITMYAEQQFAYSSILVSVEGVFIRS